MARPHIVTWESQQSEVIVMRRHRIKLDGEGFYHVTTRCVDKDFKFKDADKAAIVDEMRRLSVFCGAEVCTYAVMSNHLHLLIHMLPKAELDDEELLRRIGALYGPQREGETRERWSYLRASGSATDLETLAEEREAFKKRMGDLSNFMKELKQRISRGYNKAHRREGTLWESRFFSVLLEDSVATLQSVAAYIDLNPVRAGVAASPEDYKWGGYAQTLAGDEMAMSGLSVIYRHSTFANDFAAISKYHAEAMDLALARDRAKAERVLDHHEGDRLLAFVIQQRNAYFTRSLAIGGVDFIRKIHRQFADRFGRIRRPVPHALGVRTGEVNLHASHRLRSSAA